MTEMPTCYGGCYIKGFETNQLAPPYKYGDNSNWEEMYSAVRFSSISFLRDKERSILESLANIWNEFESLDEKHPSDDIEFCKAIHDAQKMIALRVARRANPEIWKQFIKEEPENVSTISE